MLEACRGGVLVGRMRHDWAALSVVPGAWSVSCADWRSFGLIVGVFVFLCVPWRARCLWLSPCNVSTAHTLTKMDTWLELWLFVESKARVMAFC